MPSQLRFSADDDCFQRTRNICRFAGFGVRDELIGLLAEGVNIYMKLDKEQQSVSTKSNNSEEQS